MITTYHLHRNSVELLADHVSQGVILLVDGEDCGVRHFGVQFLDDPDGAIERAG